MSHPKSLPDGWIETTIDALLVPLADGRTLHHGWSPQCETEPSASPEDWAVLKTTAVQRGAFLEQENKKLPASLEPRPNLEVQSGDILLTCAGPRARCGVPCLVRQTRARLMISGKMYRFRMPEGLVDSAYMEGWLQSEAAQSAIDAMKTGISDSGLNLTHDRFRNLTVPLAPYPEQKRIVAELEKQLTRLAAGVEGLKRVEVQLKRYRTSVLKAACEGRLVPTEAELARSEKRDYEPADKLLTRILKERRARWEADQLAKMKAAGKPPKDDSWKARYAEPEPPDSSKLPTLPEGWVWSTVGAIGDLLLGRQRAPQYLTGQHTRPYLRVANIKDNYIDYSDIESMDFDDEHFAKYQLLNGDILLSEGQSPELVGQSAIYQGSIAGLCFQKTLHRFRAIQHGPSVEFAQIVFRSHVKTGVFMRLASITTNIAHLTLEKLVAAPFPLPPKAEQDRIAAEVSAKMSMAEVAEASIQLGLTRAAKLRLGILRRAFEGSLVPQDPRDEPASKLLERISAAVESKLLPKQSRAKQTTAVLKMKATR